LFKIFSHQKAYYVNKFQWVECSGSTSFQRRFSLCHNSEAVPFISSSQNSPFQYSSCQ